MIKHVFMIYARQPQ